MEKARLDTFSNSQWPHDAVKGHGANSKAVSGSSPSILIKSYLLLVSESWFRVQRRRPGRRYGGLPILQAIIRWMGQRRRPLVRNISSVSNIHPNIICSEEHVKRKQKKCAFLKAYTEDSLLGQSTSQRPASKPASKLPASSSHDSDDELATFSSELSPPPKTSGRPSKASTTRSSSAPAKTPASRRSTRGVGKTPGSRTVSSEVEVDETDGGSESDVGKRATKSKRKTGGRTKARVSAIAEEADEAEVQAQAQGPSEDVEMEVSGPDPQPEKKKRGRPPKSAAAKPPSNAKGKAARATNDSADDLPPPKKTHGRTRSKANLQSESEAPASSSSKGTHTRTKSKSKVKQEDAEMEDLPAPTSKKGKQVAVHHQDEDALSAPVARPKGRVVSRSKVKAEPEDTEETGTVPGQEDETSLRRGRGDRSAPSNGRKSSAERKSSLSEDAGYATAEPAPDPDQMAVDDNPAPSPPPARMTHRPPKGNVVEKQPSPALNGIRSSVPPPSRASSVRPSIKLNKDSLQVIEIDSDGEDSGARSTSSKAKTRAPKAPTRTASGTKLKKQASQTSKNVPVAEDKTKAVLDSPLETEDVPMENVSRSRPPGEPTKGQPEAEPLAPGTPISAVHRSVLPSPVHDPAAGGDIDMAGSGPIAPAEPPRSRQTYHPFLSQFPIEEMAKLTDEEAEMTLEQYIRREMEVQYAQLKADAERRIEEFKQKAAETRKVIEMS